MFMVSRRIVVGEKSLYFHLGHNPWQLFQSVRFQDTQNPSFIAVMVNL
jgi:hypothetical protein